MLLERIEEDLRQAMKNHEAGRVSILRFLRASIQNAAIAARTSVKKSLDEADVEQVIKQELKRLRDSLVDFTKAARADLVEATKKEVAVLSEYLPKEMDPTELKLLIVEIVNKLKTEGITDFGQAMKRVVSEVKGRADGKTISETVKSAFRDETKN